MKPHLKEYIDEFNNGEFDDLLKIFGSMEQILIFFHKQNLLQFLNPFREELEDYQNQILNYLLNNLNDKQVMRKTITKLSDVVLKDDGYYLRLSHKSDLASLFKFYSRGISSKDIVELMLNDNNFEHFSNTTDDIYRDVIEVLTPENIQILKKHKLDVLNNWKIEVDDDTPDFFHDEVGVDGNFYVTPANVGDIIGNEELFMYLLDNDYLPDVTGNLHSIHYNAYNNAYESELYNAYESELSTFFDVETGKWVSEPNSSNPEKLREFYYIKFNPNEVQNSIKKYVSDRHYWMSYQYTIDYMDDWTLLMYELMESGKEEWLDFRIPDYPDGRLVDKYINELFTEYI